MKGQHPKKVSALLGHGSIALILDKYSHIIPGLDRGEDVIMEDTLG